MVLLVHQDIPVLRCLCTRNMAVHAATRRCMTCAIFCVAFDRCTMLCATVVFATRALSTRLAPSGQHCTLHVPRWLSRPEHAGGQRQRAVVARWGLSCSRSPDTQPVGAMMPPLHHVPPVASAAGARSWWAPMGRRCTPLPRVFHSPGTQMVGAAITPLHLVPRSLLRPWEGAGRRKRAPLHVVHRLLSQPAHAAG